ncbi:hypothetical protein B5E82_04415 [Lachnoclostridium sp. An138]|nr:hypothetical protein B5E82_04415 [Lachnoclostridium sp. An138]
MFLRRFRHTGGLPDRGTAQAESLKPREKSGIYFHRSPLLRKKAFPMFFEHVLSRVCHIIP